MLIRLVPVANLLSEEPDALIAHVRICGSPVRVIGGATRFLFLPTNVLARLQHGQGCVRAI